MPRLAQLEGRFRHVVYSPKGEIEGALIELDGADAQLVFERHDEAAAAAFLGLKPGQRLGVEATPRPPSDKGDAAHPTFDLVRLARVDGARFKAPQHAGEHVYAGRVVRFNHARHGEPNGVVLDSGDFIHLKPDGLRRAKLKLGDTVRAVGDAQLLATGDGWAVEAWTVNGRAVRP